MFLSEIIKEDSRRDILRKFGAGALAAAGVKNARADDLDDFVTHYNRQNLPPIDDDRLGIIIQFFNDAKEKIATAATNTVKASNPQAPAHPASQQAKATSQQSARPVDITHNYVPITKSPLEPLLKKIAQAANISGAYLLAFLATCAHESAMFTRLNEIGSDQYFFDRYDKNGKNPKKAKDLGNTQPGDGVLFHGRGFIMLTGRWNYTAASKDLFNDDRLVKNPDLVLRPDVAVRTSIWFWKNQVQPSMKKSGTTDITSATRRVNPGMKHLDRRQKIAHDMKVAQNTVKEDV